jgi:sulfopyruvate decarboxylase TPP-binding subunit
VLLSQGLLAMIDGPALVAALTECGISHVIWIPDSDVGTWDQALRTAPALQLIRVCREGEAMAIAAGLLLGGKKPLVILQCTGLFEAGDALRNVVHDMKLPLFLMVGIRNYEAYQRRASADNCPVFTEPIMRAWQIPYILLQRERGAAELVTAYRQAQVENRAGAVLLPE